MPNQIYPNSLTPDPGHVNCVSCGVYNVPQCESCGRHVGCCQCFMCNTCRRRHPRRAQCQKCGHCRVAKRCVCHADPKHAGGMDLRTHLPPGFQGELERIRVPMESGATLRSGRPYPVTLGRAMSVELELSAYTGNIMTTTSSVAASHHADGSIRGDRPVELCVGPMVGRSFEAAHVDLAKWLQTSRAQVNVSCGMHVHVSAKDFGPFETRRAIQMYQVLEPMFYRLVAESRGTNSYCKLIPSERWDVLLECSRARSGREIRQLLSPAIYIGSDQMSASKTRKTHSGNNGQEDSRYFGLNLHSLFYRGTLEFRMHEGCVDPARIRSWMLWCGWFVELASRLQDAEVGGLRTPEDYLYGVWKRPTGLLALPREVVAYAKAGRADADEAPIPEGARPLRDALGNQRMQRAVAPDDPPVGPADIAAARARLRAREQAMAADVHGQLGAALQNAGPGLVLRPRNR